jgi:cation:H+ antiporter
MTIQFIILLLGLTLVWSGAELLIRYSSALARGLGVSPVIIGLTIVSFGTSLPEFVVSLMAALQDTKGISVGNIIGSNIANICLILGVGALLTKLTVKKPWVFKEVPFMIGSTILFLIFAKTSYTIVRWEGIILLSLLAVFIGYLSKTSIHQIQNFTQSGILTDKISHSKKILYLILSILGIVILITGSKLTVSSGSEIASQFGVSDVIIGLTLIAVGTSLPELATTIVGAFKNETDIVVGNVIGSNIFNLLFIGGTVTTISPLDISPDLFNLEFVFLLGSALLIWPIMRLEWNVKKAEGIFLILLYSLFIYLVVF